MEGPELPVLRRRMRPLIICVLSALALLVLLASGLGISLLVSERRVREELSKILAAGEPVTVADLRRFYSPPPGSPDATSLWLEAVAVVRQPEYRTAAAGLPFVGDHRQDVPPADEPWPEQAAVEHFLTRYDDLLENLYKAASMRGAARYPTSFAPYGDDSEATLVGLRAICRLLTLECEFHLRQGDSHAAARSVDAIFALAKSLERHPTLVALLSRISYDRVAFNYLRQTLAAHELSDDDLALLDADLAAIDYYAHFHQAMLGARVMSMEIFDNPEPLVRAAPGTAGPIFFRQADRAVFLRLMREVVAASAAPDQASLGAKMGDARESIRQAFASRLAGWKYPIAKFSLSSLDAFVDGVGRGTARRDIARTAIAIERFGVAQGRLPKTLGDLVPDFLPGVPSDPFDGAPLRLIVSGKDYRVYSVGPDGVDQAGEIDESGAEREIVLRVPLCLLPRGTHVAATELASRRALTDWLERAAPHGFPTRVSSAGCGGGTVDRTDLI